MKLLSFLINMGKVLLLYSIMFVISIVIYTRFNKGKTIYENRCTIQPIENIENIINFQEIDKIEYNQTCNTIYLNLEANLTKEEYKGILTRYYQLFQNIGYQGNIQIIASSPLLSQPIFASISSLGISIN